LLLFWALDSFDRGPFFFVFKDCFQGCLRNVHLFPPFQKKKPKPGLVDIQTNPFRAWALGLYLWPLSKLDIYCNAFRSFLKRFQRNDRQPLAAAAF
jgi:hypothetical protein